VIALAEAPACYAARPWRLAERELAELWHGQRFPPGALTTTLGEPLGVVFRGRPGRGAGPDYRDAILALPDGRVLQGDVELHIRAADCVAHGHRGDPAYARVVLHLVVYDDAPGPLGIGPDTMRTVALERWLATRASDLEGWLRQPPLWQEPCLTAVERRGAAAVSAILRRTGDRRLEEHAQAFRRDLECAPAEAVLIRALFDGLGYSQNRGPFGQIAAVALELAPTPASHVEAVLFATAGFLEGQDAHARELAYRAGATVALPLSWRTWGIRPENHPQRRLAGGVALLERLQAAGGAVRATADALLAEPGSIINLLTVAAEGYWQDHILLGRRGCGRALVGAVRAAELAVNAVLPFFVAFGELHGREDLVAASRSLYGTLPATGDYGVVRPIHRALRDGRRSLVRSAGDQQALIYLFKGYCSRGRCLECPFAHEAPERR
jgi:hypothetical protein